MSPTFPTPEHAWAVMAVGEDRQHGGNDGYDDTPDRYYSWDSTVSNHGNIAIGHVIVLWNKVTLLGASLIDDLQLGAKNKTTYSCPHCGRANIKARATKSPRYRCFVCQQEFAEPRRESKVVITYRTEHGSSWVDLTGVLSAADVRAVCRSPRSQLSMRELDWTAFVRAVERAGAQTRLAPLFERLELTAG